MSQHPGKPTDDEQDAAAEAFYAPQERPSLLPELSFHETAVRLSRRGAVSEVIEAALQQAFAIGVAHQRSVEAPRFDIVERLHQLLTTHGIASYSLPKLTTDLVDWAAAACRQSKTRITKQRAMEITKRVMCCALDYLRADIEQPDDGACVISCSDAIERELLAALVDQTGEKT